VVIFADTRATRLLEQICPSVYVKGGDYTPETLNAEERHALDRCGSEIRIVPFEQGYSTSNLIDKMQGPPP
jgi:bifunctional ADP-heptose synthase (sugar kinase/adenylyltransferase)